MDTGQPLHLSPIDCEILGRDTTPYVREILTHHFETQAPFPRPTALYRDYVDQFVAMGLLRREGDEVRGVDEALRVYMDALAAVPLPVQRWVIPLPDLRFKHDGHNSVLR